MSIVQIEYLSSMHAGIDYSPPPRQNNDRLDQFGNVRWRATCNRGTTGNRKIHKQSIRIVQIFWWWDSRASIEVVEVMAQCVISYLPRSACVHHASPCNNLMIKVSVHVIVDVQLLCIETNNNLYACRAPRYNLYCVHGTVMWRVDNIEI